MDTVDAADAPGPSANAPEPDADLAAQAGGPRASSMNPITDDELLPALTDAVHELRPPMAAYLGRAQSAALDATGALTIVLPHGGEVWKRRLSGKAGKEALAEAAARVLGAAPPSIHLAIDSAGPAAAAEETEPPPPREEILDRARKDPLVREIFDRFGAVVLEGGPPPAKGARTDAPKSRPPGGARR